MIIYLAGKYSSDSELEHTRNVNRARTAAIELWEAGHAVICPHLNSLMFEKMCDVSYDNFLSGYVEIMKRCDAIVLLPGWQDSFGAKTEYAAAFSAGVKSYEWPKYPGKE
jgi:uncharacterized radical SAM superfamily protein